MLMGIWAGMTISLTEKDSNACAAFPDGIPDEIIWAKIWITSEQITSAEVYMAINFAFGFFGGFLVVSFAQIKELFPIAIAGTRPLPSTYSLLQARPYCSRYPV
jgi:hypothetical protein